MAARNKVIAGDYEGKMIIQTFGQLSINSVFKTYVDLNKKTIKEYEIINEKSQKSIVSAVGRGFVGSLVLGPAGLLAGLSAKSKSTHLMAVQFNDGKKSLLEIDDKIYDKLIKILF